MALCIVAFAVMAIVSTLPVGINLVVAAKEENMAAAALRTLQARLLSAPVVRDGNNWRQSIPGIDGASWLIGGAPFELGTFQLGVGGHPAGNDNDGSVVVRATVMPPADLFSPGRANLKIAWPSVATWDGTKWKGERGSLETMLFYMPRPIEP